MITQIIFYIFAIMLVMSALMVVLARNPVYGVLFLVAAFFSAAVLWILLQAEFLGLVLIFVYVGAVMTLFLFVVMMLNMNIAPKRARFVRYLPFGVIVLALLLGITLIVFAPSHFLVDRPLNSVMFPADFSNTKALGEVLYTHYVYPFELAAALLFVAIIAAISLAYRGRRNSKAQKVVEQVTVKAKDRLNVIEMTSE